MIWKYYSCREKASDLELKKNILFSLRDIVMVKNTTYQQAFYDCTTITSGCLAAIEGFARSNLYMFF
jgi:hypothetical protein